MREKQTVTTCLLCTDEGRLTANSGRSQKSIVARFSVSPNLKGDVYDLQSTELPLSMPTSNSSEIEQLPDTTLLMVPGSTD